MARYTVLVDQLHKRTAPATDFADRSNVAGVVLRAFSFESTGSVHNSLGTWEQDRDGYFYWSGGLAAAGAPEASAPPPIAGWQYAGMGLDALWSRSRGAGITVAVLDSGLNEHPDAFGDESGFSFINACTGSTERADCLDSDNGHGTDCAALLCAQGGPLRGVAPAISPLLIRVTDDSGQRSNEALRAGLAAAIAHGVDVINLSCRMEPGVLQEEIHALIRTAFDKNITVVAAVDDSGGVPFIINSYPASFPECLSVGGYNKDRQRSRSSAKSSFIDLVAPAEEYPSLERPGTLLQGNSYSAPYVSGCVALLKSIFKAEGIPLPNAVLLDALKRSARQDLTGYNTLEYGWGAIDPAAALNLLSTENS